MPSPRKKTSVNLKKKILSATPEVASRASSRIRTNTEIKEEPVEEESNKSSVKKKVNLKKPLIKPKGKTVQAATSVKEKAKRIVYSKRRRESLYYSTRINPKMTVLAVATARKRKLNGEDDDDVPRKKTIKKPQKKKIKKKPALFRGPLPSVEFEFSDDVPQDEEIFDDDQTEEHQTMVAIKQEEGECEQEEYEEHDLQYEEEFEDNEEENNLLINEEHQYIDMEPDMISGHHDDGDMEVSQDHVQGELQDELPDDEDEEHDDDEDIDENLFFGIPEQPSPDLATCTHCKGKFRKEDVHEHMLTCPERYVQCRECGKILSNLQTLERHHKRFHLKIREVPCTLCDKMFIDEAAARKHLKTVHFKVKNFHCPHCDKSFSQRNKLTYHVRTHSGEKPYSCAECGRSFSLLWNLKTHLRTHTGEKPYSCDTCGRRFTQKQNMTSHLTTHRKPKQDKSFRASFHSDLDDYDANADIISNAEFSSVKSKNNIRALDQAKQLGVQTIGSNHYVLGDMQNIEVQTADDQNIEHSVNLEHGLGLLSSVARKGDSTDVQVDGIVNIPENQLTMGSNLDQVVEVLVRSNPAFESENKTNEALNAFQFANSSQSKIILDPNTQVITDGNGQEITMDTNTAAGLANILQNPDVLAAINSAASTNKFIVIGPVSMFDGSSTSNNFNSSDPIMTDDVSSTFSQEQLAQISSIVATEQDIDASEVSPQTVSDSISVTTTLAAVENYLQGDEQPSSSLSKNDEVVSDILTSMQPSGKRAILPNTRLNIPSPANNMTIAMPPMPQSTLVISPSTLSINVDSNSTRGMRTVLPSSAKTVLPSSVKPLSMSTCNASSSEVSSTVDHVNIGLRFSAQESSQMEGHMEAQSTTEEFNLRDRHNNEPSDQSYVHSHSPGLADSTDMVVDSAGDEASSSGEPILMLVNDENGQPQIIVKMPDGTETIMSDPALAESLIQVPTITNADMVCENDLNEAEPSQSMVIDHIGDSIHLHMPEQVHVPDQGIPQTMRLGNPGDLPQVSLSNESDLQPSQSGLNSSTNYSPNPGSSTHELDMNEAESTHQVVNDVRRIPSPSSSLSQHAVIDSTYPHQHNEVDSAYQIASSFSHNADSNADSAYSHDEDIVHSVYSPKGGVDSADDHVDSIYSNPNNVHSVNDLESMYSHDNADSAYCHNDNGAVDDADSVYSSHNNVDSFSGDESVYLRHDAVHSISGVDSHYAAPCHRDDTVHSVSDVVGVFSSGSHGNVNSVNNADSVYVCDDEGNVTSVPRADSVYPTHDDNIDSVSDADSAYVMRDGNVGSVTDADSVYRCHDDNVDSASDADSVYATHNDADSVYSTHNDADSVYGAHNGADSVYSRQDYNVHCVNDPESTYSQCDNVDSAYTHQNDDGRQREDDVDSSSNVGVSELHANALKSKPKANASSESTIQTPDSSSQSSRRVMMETHVDSPRQAVFVMEHVTGSRDSDQPEQSHLSVVRTADSNRSAMADSSSSSRISSISERYLQLQHVSQSSNSQRSSDDYEEAQVRSENVSSTDQTE